MRRRQISTATLVLLLATACSPPPATTPATRPSARALAARPPITADELRRDLYVFAADSFRGRETGTADAQRAAAFLARRIQLMGLEPAGDSLYMQRVPLVRQTLTGKTQFAVIERGRVRSLRLGGDIAPVLRFGDDGSETKRAAAGDVVFVGYGLDQLSRSAQPLDLAGKVVVVLHGAPVGTDPKRVSEMESQQVLGARLGRILPLQPAAVVVLMTGGAEALYRQAVPQLLRTVVPPSTPGANDDRARALPMVLLGVASSAAALLPARGIADTRMQALGKRFVGSVEVETRDVVGFNVVGVVRGTDPMLRHSYVAFGAHYDHLGIVAPYGRGANGAPSTDSIANGADDDGSGSVALLAIAREMMRSRPRRSAVFVWHVAEEQGMLGSAYFTRHPTLPIDSVVAQLNADMIGRNAPDRVSLIGPRAAPNFQSWRLGMIVDSVNRALPRPFVIDRSWDVEDHPEQIYQRSDHYNYAKLGIPIVFFTTGMHDDYHAASDEPSTIDYDKMARVARLMLESGLAVANRRTRPTSDAAAQIVSSYKR